MKVLSNNILLNRIHKIEIIGELKKSYQ